MTKRSALIIGGTGQIGRAIALTLAESGWSVSVTHRGTKPLPPALADKGVTAVVHDRDRNSGLKEAIRSGADVLIDAIAYDASHADQLLEIREDIGSFVVISSSSVYCDASGRSLDEGRINGFPDLPDPMTEDHRTLPPGDQNYSTRKAALEQRLLEHSTIPVAILRPCAIHGAYSVHPREWWFVKRMLDGRNIVPLAYAGESRFHTTSVANIAGLAAVVVNDPVTRILNIGDDRCLRVRDIGEVLRQRMQFRGRFALIADGSYPPVIGATPWSVPAPFMIDSSAARSLGFVPLAYEATISSACDWLLAFTADGQWKETLPVFSRYENDPFDYHAEDAYLSSGRGFELA